MRIIAQLEQADPGDDSQGIFDKRQTSAQKEAGHEPPAGTPEAVAANQFERFVLPESGRPRHQEIGERGGGADLDQLGARAHFAQREHARRGSPHHDQEMGDLGSQRDRRQDRQAERDHHGEALVIGDRHDHPGDRHRDDLGIPGLCRQDAHDGQGQDHQPADHRDPAGIADKPPLVPVDVRARQEIECGHQGEDPDDAPGPVAETERGHRGVVLEAKQDELLFADRLSLFDQHLAPRIGVEMVGDAVASRFSQLRPWPRPRTTKSEIVSSWLAIRPKRIWPTRGEVKAEQNS